MQDLFNIFNSDRNFIFFFPIHPKQGDNLLRLKELLAWKRMKNFRKPSPKQETRENPSIPVKKENWEGVWTGR